MRLWRFIMNKKKILPVLLVSTLLFGIPTTTKPNTFKTFLDVTSGAVGSACSICLASTVFYGMNKLGEWTCNSLRRSLPKVVAFLPKKGGVVCIIGLCGYVAYKHYKRTEQRFVLE